MLPAVTSGKIERIENFISQYVKARNIGVWLLKVTILLKNTMWCTSTIASHCLTPAQRIITILGCG
jgi:hypothetical protein